MTAYALGPLLLIWINSLNPGKFEWNFSYVIFKRILVIDDAGIPCETALLFTFPWLNI